MPIHIENETHWRTPDIKRLVKTVLDAIGADPARERRVKVIYNVKRRKKKRGAKSKAPAVTSVSKIDFDVDRQKKVTKLTIRMPKNGPKEIHANPMVAIAASAGAPGPGALLSPSQTFWLANGLAWDLIGEPGSCEKQVEQTFTRRRGGFPGQPVMEETYTEIVTVSDKEKVDMFYKGWETDAPPSWADATKLLICKVKDPKKDGTYLAFIAKKKTAIKRAETAIEKEIAAVESAKRRLKAARDRKKKAEKALRDAAERRS